MNPAILFINGEVDTKFSQEHIQKNYHTCEIFCADGAYNKISSNQYLCQRLKAIFGDFDSIDPEIRKDIPKNINQVLLHDQNDTDFCKSLKLLFQDFDEVIVYGASGLEMDHYLSNLSSAIKWINKKNLKFIDKYSEFYFIPKKFVANDVKGRMISVVPFLKATGITYSGLKYPLINESLTFGNRIGVRNYAIEDSISINYDHGLLLVFISHYFYKGYTQENNIDE